MSVLRIFIPLILLDLIYVLLTILYARVTIDGKDKEISLGRKVHPDFWDVENKRDTQPGAEAKKTNSKIIETQATLESHFMVLRSQYELIYYRAIPT